MNNSEVAHNWAHDNYNRNGELNGSNMYALKSNRTIYSYGSHFPIARKTDSPTFPVLMTYRGYSNSTGKHITHVWRSLSYRTVFMCHSPSDSPQGIYRREMTQDVPDKIKDLNECSERVVYWQRRVDAREAKGMEPSDMLDRNLNTARENEASAHTAVRDRIDELEKFRLDFEITIRDCHPMVRKMRDRYRKGKWLSIPSDLAKIAERAAKQRQRELDEIERKKREQEAENLERWLDGDRVQLHYQTNPAQMRIGNNRTVETTLGARVSVDDALKAIRFVDIVRKRGTDWHSSSGNQHHIGPFAINSITDTGIRVGCHTFEFSEIDRMRGPIERRAEFRPFDKSLNLEELTK